MQHIKIFSDKFTHVFVSAAVKKQLLWLCNKYNIQSQQVEDISPDIFTFIQQYYSNGEPASKGNYSISRVLQLLELRVGIWKLLVDATAVSKQAASPLLFAVIQRDAEIVHAFCSVIGQNKYFRKTAKASLQLLMTNRAALTLLKNTTINNTKSGNKEPVKLAANTRSLCHREVYRAVSSKLTIPYKVYTIEDYFCRNRYKPSNPVIYTGMTA